MESITLSPKRAEITEYLSRNIKNLRLVKISISILKLNQATVRYFLARFFPGRKAGHYAAFGHQAKEASKTSQKVSHIGTDEVGNGSYFGGLAVVASFVVRTARFLCKL